MNRIAQFLSRRRMYDDVSREIEQHLREKVDGLVDDGMPLAEAEAAARRAFGNAALVADRSRDAWGWRWIEDLLFDIRYAARQLRRHRLVAMAAIATLALGIGANTSIFSAIEAVLLQPLPYPHADRLVLVEESLPGSAVDATGSPLARYLSRASNAELFADAGAYWDVSGGNGVVFGAPASAERVQSSIVSNSLLRVLGAEPVLGRGFSADEGMAGSGSRVFLASNGLWRRSLGSDPGAVGKRFRIDGEDYTLVGVLPPSFHFPADCEVWMPLGSLPAAQAHDRLSHQFRMVARLQTGVTRDVAEARLNALQQQWARSYPATDANWRVMVAPLVDHLVGDSRAALWVLMAAATFVLLIACTNVAHLLLVRTLAREKEFAVRAGLGAGRGRLVRQVLAETLLLAVAGAAAATAVARVALHALIVLDAGSIPRFEQARLSGAAFAFSAGLAIVTALLVGLAPGLHASRVAFAESLQAGARSGLVNRRGRRSRNLLVVLEVGLTVLLLTAAGVTLRSFQRLTHVDPGFRPAGLVTMKIALPDAAYPDVERRSAFLRVLLDRVNSTPGIEAAAAIDRLPLSGERNWGTFTIVGRPATDAAHAPSMEGRAVSAGYFRTLGIPLLRGRELTADDVIQNRPVVVINRAMAERFWPGRDPVGQAIMSPYHPNAPPRRIVGVVGNVKDFSLGEESPPEAYTPIRWWNQASLVLRSDLAPAAAAAAVRSQVNALDRGVPLYDGTSVETLVGRSVAAQRFELVLLALFASMALALAAVGIYGVLAFAVSCRTQEIGVRLALGATPARATAMVLKQGMTHVLSGIAAGLIASLGLVRLMRGLLFHVSPSDPATLAAVGAILAAVGLLACGIPARRAMRVDPIAALRAE